MQLHSFDSNKDTSSTKAQPVNLYGGWVDSSSLIDNTGEQKLFSGSVYPTTKKANYSPLDYVDINYPTLGKGYATVTSVGAWHTPFGTEIRPLTPVKRRLSLSEAQDRMNEIIDDYEKQWNEFLLTEDSLNNYEE